MIFLIHQPIVDLFHFRKPQDNDRRDLWIKEIKKYQKIDQSFVICQNHFEPKYLRNQKHGIRLTKDAIPTLFDAKPLPIPLETISSKTVPKQIAYVDMKPTIQFITSTEHQQDFGHVPQTESHQQQSKACVRCIQQDVKIQMLQVKIQKLQNTCDQRRDTIDSLRKELNILKRPDPSMQERCPVCYDKFPAVDEHLCNGKTVVGCEYCDETFTSTSKLLSHLSTQHHDKRFYKCEFCPRRFPMLILMVFHEKCHPSDKSEVACEFCDVKYVTKYQLNKHIEEMHSNAPTIQKLYECGTCGECYSTAQQLLNHRSTAHVKLGIFECFLCKLKLQSLKETRHHLMETHQRDIKCVVCNDMFTNLEIEMHKCTGLESLDCVYCEQTFKTTQTLLQHLNDCTAEKFIHKCNYCREYFFMKSLIDRHMMHHEGDKDFACDLCSKSFAKKELLSIHKRRHNAIADSICDECGKGPFTVENLRRHKKTHSDYDNECPQCGRKFQHTKGLNRHLKNVHHDRQHQVVCSICGAKVQSFRALYKHKCKPKTALCIAN